MLVSSRRASVVVPRDAPSIASPLRYLVKRDLCGIYDFKFELGEPLAGKNIFTTFAGDKVYEKTHTYRYADANDGFAIGASIRTGSDGTSYAPA